MNIYQRINAVMQDIQYLTKDDRVEYKNTKYKAISEEKVTTAVRSSMMKNGLVMFPIQQSISRDEQITTVNVTYQMVNMDNPDEMILIASSGQGYDSQDKGSGKAMTYAFKYALLRTFMIPTGEDPDKVSSEQIDDEQGKGDQMKPALRSHILQMAGGDLTRVNTFLNRLFATDGSKTLDDLSNSEMVQLDRAIAKKVADGT